MSDPISYIKSSGGDINASFTDEMSYTRLNEGDDAVARITYKPMPLRYYGYVSAESHSVVDTQNSRRTGLLYVRGYDVIEANVLITSSGYAIALYDINRNLLPDLSVVGMTDGGLTYNRYEVDLTDESMSDVYYAQVSIYHGPSTPTMYWAMAYSKTGVSGFVDEVSKLRMLPTMRDAIDGLNSFVKNASIPFTNKGYVSTNNTVIATDNARHTDPIYIHGCKSIRVKTTLSGAGYAVTFLNGSGRIDYWHSIVGNGTMDTVIDLTQDMYKDVYFAIVSGYDASQSFSGFEFVLNPSNDSSESARHYGTFSILGDSYSTFDGYLATEGAQTWYPETYNDGQNDVKNVEQTWWWKFANGYGCRLLENESWSGSTISYDSYGAGDNDGKATSFITRCDSLTTPELIFIFGGTNDVWAANDTGTLDFLGEYMYSGWTEDDLTKFRPALAYLIDKLQRKHVGSTILFILNTGIDAADESVKTICTHYGVGVIELSNIDKGHSHPTDAGMTSICDQVTSYLESM